MGMRNKVRNGIIVLNSLSVFTDRFQPSFCLSSTSHCMILITQQTELMIVNDLFQSVFFTFLPDFSASLNQPSYFVQSISFQAKYHLSLYPSCGLTHRIPSPGSLVNGCQGHVDSSFLSFNAGFIVEVHTLGGINDRCLFF